MKKLKGYEEAKTLIFKNGIKIKLVGKKTFVNFIKGSVEIHNKFDIVFENYYKEHNKDVFIVKLTDKEVRNYEDIPTTI